MLELGLVGLLIAISYGMGVLWYTRILELSILPAERTSKLTGPLVGSIIQ